MERNESSPERGLFNPSDVSCQILVHSLTHILSRALFKEQECVEKSASWTTHQTFVYMCVTVVLFVYTPTQAS